VNIITIKNIYLYPNELWKSFAFVDSVELDDDTEFGVDEFKLYDMGFVQQYAVMVIANQPGYEHTFTTSYEWIASRK
jgi:hypothetical protein